MTLSKPWEILKFEFSPPGRISKFSGFFRKIGGYLIKARNRLWSEFYLIYKSSHSGWTVPVSVGLPNFQEMLQLLKEKLSDYMTILKMVILRMAKMKGSAFDLTPTVMNNCATKTGSLEKPSLRAIHSSL